MSESWRPIPGLNGYEVSDIGNLRSARWVRDRPPGTAISQRPTIWGYMSACISSDEGDIRPRVVHRLVLLAFVGPCPTGHEARHIDGDRKNNSLSNLRWGTKDENAADRIAHGTQVRGEKVNTSRLTPEQVREIRRRYADESIGHRRLAAAYGVARNTIAGILTGKTWAHLV